LGVDVAYANDSAYPVQFQKDESTGVVVNYAQSGLTKLEYFAGLAMQGLCTNAGRNGYLVEQPQFIVAASVKAARALLAELEKPQ
jgi:hypothetical protein